MCDETHVCIWQTPFWALISPFLLSSVIIFSRIEVLQETSFWYVCETSCLFSALFFCCLIDHSTPASQSPHSSNPSSLPSSPPTHNHNSVPFSNFGPIGTPDNRDRRAADRWKTDKPAMGGFGIDYLSATSSSESSWHQTSTPSGTWTGHGPSMEDSSAVLMESLKVSGLQEQEPQTCLRFRLYKELGLLLRPLELIDS